jgi:molecular chaperone DnaJ
VIGSDDADDGMIARFAMGCDGRDAALGHRTPRRAGERTRWMNHYDVLGVEPTASARTIARAHRAIALETHPDKVSNGTDGEKAAARARFDAAQRAYETLRDDARRMAYDSEMEVNGGRRDDVMMNVTFAESARGGTKLAVVPFKMTCERCDGRGRIDDAKGGEGDEGVCGKCRGDGVMDAYYHGRVHVPRGVAHGARLPIVGRSQSVRVRILPSKQFTRDGMHVKSTLRLSAEQAREGGFFDVETVYGTETVYFDEETKSGDTKTLRGKGLEQGKKLGDHIVVVQVERERAPEDEGEPSEDEDDDSDAKKRKQDDEDDDSDVKKRKQDDEDDKDDVNDAKQELEGDEDDEKENSSNAAPDASDLERLLAEKKAKLLAQLDAAGAK